MFCPIEATIKILNDLFSTYSFHLHNRLLNEVAGASNRASFYLRLARMILRRKLFAIFLELKTFQENI